MPERFTEPIRQILAADGDVLVLITGAASKRVAAENIKVQCASARCIAFAGHSILEEPPALYALAT
jgi:hypothetical protein